MLEERSLLNLVKAPFLGHAFVSLAVFFRRFKIEHHNVHDMVSVLTIALSDYIALFLLSLSETTKIYKIIVELIEWFTAGSPMPHCKAFYNLRFQFLNRCSFSF